MLLLVICVSDETVKTAAGAILQAGGRPQRKGSLSESNSRQGAGIFASSCAGCHGLDGRGGERAPNIVDRPSVLRLSDSEIYHIIENGIPGTSMPAFHSLQSSQIKAVVTHLRTLQGTKKTVKLPGNPERGRAIFFGKAGCSECHMAAGKGGFIASDLSGYARTHTADQIRGAITNPGLSRGRPVRLATATIHSGEKYVGRIRNEDNFSIQLQTQDGTFHFISKSDLEGLEYDSKPLMPSDYGSTLTRTELDDVVSYLMGVANASEMKVPEKVEKGWEEQ